MQKPLIIANWKMNPITLKEAKHLFEVVKKGISGFENVEVVICPPFVWLNRIWGPGPQRFGDLVPKLGAQNCHWETKGAYTGEISPLMLKDSGCEYALVGHSERRQYFGETDEIVSKKLRSVLKARLKPILCAGEETNEMGLTVQEQIEKGLKGVSFSRIRDIVIAYEPVWAISAGNGLFCPPDEAMKARLLIKKILSKLYNRQTAEAIRILYGGSVNFKNAADYVKKAGMNGLLVGGAGLNASEFVKIVEKVR